MRYKVLIADHYRTDSSSPTNCLRLVSGSRHITCNPDGHAGPLQHFIEDLCIEMISDANRATVVHWQIGSDGVEQIRAEPLMSESSDNFEQSIQDAENLLKHFNALNTKPPPPELEVLKRAGLIMAMTAWETYVEYRVVEEASQRLKSIKDADIANFVAAKLHEEIKRLHNPDYQKTVQLFRDYTGVDLKASWSWNHHDIKAVRDKLNRYIRLRGDVVHRSRKVSQGPSESHPVKKGDLEKAIRFLKNLVAATEKGFG